ncbi:alpha/beta hydrolase [Candidatus Gracilibacteria bacterium]|nr:alpha/beta hydrolase [Candidatus Gracilibacteria bacterium]
MGGSLDTSSASKSYTNISYATDSETQKLDIYIPTGSGSFPVIVAIHGGAFKLGSKTGSDVKSMFSGLKRGYAVVSIDYRLSGEAIFPAAIDDVQSAIVWIKQNGKQYNLDPSKIVLWGDSAGGNLAALAGTKGNTQSGTNVQVVVDWFGPIYFSRMDDQFALLGVTPKMGKTNTNSSPESQYLGKTIGTPEAESLVKAASPETYISADDPVFYIQHGSADTNIPYLQSEELANKLMEVLGKDKVVFEKLEGASHGGDQFDADENLSKIFKFLEIHLQ